MKRKLVMLLTAAMIATTVTPALPMMTSTVYAAGSASSEIYQILTEGGLSSAAACGILGNMEQESGLDPNASGRYYGLVQWDSSRSAALKAYCSANGYSASSISGQVHFLLYELESSYSGVLSELQSVPDTAEGAVSAAKAFCRGYEQTGNYDWEYSTRGSFASTYYSMYGGSSSSETDESDEDASSSDTSEDSSSESEESTNDTSASESSEDSSEESSDSSEETSDEEESSDDEESSSDEDVSSDETNETEEDADDGSAESDSEESEEASDESSDESDETADDESSEDGEYSDSDFQYLLSQDYDVSLIFDYDYYTSRYPDVVDTVGSDYDSVLHYFLTYGVEHGQRGSLNFSVVNYQNNNPDLVDKYADEYVKYYVEYVQSGHDEGRDGSVSEEQNDEEQKRAQEEAEWQEYLDSIGMTQEEYNEYIAEKGSSDDESSDDESGDDSSYDENASDTDESNG